MVAVPNQSLGRIGAIAPLMSWSCHQAGATQIKIMTISLSVSRKMIVGSCWSSCLVFLAFIHSFCRIHSCSIKGFAPSCWSRRACWFCYTGTLESSSSRNAYAESYFSAPRRSSSLVRFMTASSKLWKIKFIHLFLNFYILYATFIHLYKLSNL